MLRFLLFNKEVTLLFTENPGDINLKIGGYMNKLLITALIVCCMTVGCGSKQSDEHEIIGGANEPTVIDLDSDKSQDEDSTNAEITDDDALKAIKNYCYEAYPEAKEFENSEEEIVYWNIESSDDNQIVVAFRSYTGAIVRFYIEKATGETYITEYVDGITPEEEKTGETFNVKDYIK